MNEAEFDSVANEYEAQHRTNIAITGEGPEFFAEYKIVAAQAITQARDLTVRRILDFGSGIGNSIPYFRRLFPGAALTCSDASQRSLALSQTRFPGGEDYALVDGQSITVADAMADLCFSACVFHHIPHEEHVHWLAELRRTTRPGGMLIVFEHNPLNPLTLRAVNTCPFDVNARLIRAAVLASRLAAAGWRDVTTRYHIFFPRRLAWLRPLEGALQSVPFGAQYSLSAVAP